MKRLPEGVGGIGDLAYIGIDKLHPHGLGASPRRKPRGKPRPPADVTYNTAFSRGSSSERVTTNKVSDELRRNRLEIDAKLMNSHIAMQVTLMDTTKGTQEITQSSPQAFIAVGVGLKPTIAIVVPRPFLRAMTHCVPHTPERVVTLVLIGVDERIRLRKLLDKRTQRQTLGVLHHAQPDPAGFASNHA
jgi:hypothetical protein